MNWCSVYLTPQDLPKYIYLSPPLIFPTTYNGIRTKNRPVWITLGAAPIHWMGPIHNPRWEQKRTEAVREWGLRYRIYGEMRGCKENSCSNRVQHHFLRARWLWMNRKMIGEAWQIRCFPYGERSDVPRLQQVEQKTVRRQRNLGPQSLEVSKIKIKIRNFGHLYFILVSNH